MNFNKFILLALVSLSLVLACHQSCSSCAEDNYTCLECYDPDNSYVLPQHRRSCFCKPGYFLLTSRPWKCEQILAGSSIDRCEKAFVEMATSVPLDIDCGTIDLDSTNYVYTTATLRIDDSPIPEECKSIIRADVVYYKDINADVKDPATPKYHFPEEFVIFEENYIGTTIFIPLIEVFNYAINEDTNEEGDIKQTLVVAIIYSHTRKEIRQNTWKVAVYTSRNEVNVVSIDVTKRYTSGCKDGEECIVMQDLDTELEVCSDVTCNEILEQGQNYAVGDSIFFRVKFVDASFLKWLKLSKLFYKTDDDRIFNFTADTITHYNAGYTIFELRLLYPSVNALIQVNMKIVTSKPSSLLRALATDDEETMTRSLEFTVTGSLETNSSLTLLFSLLNLIALVFFF